MSTKINAMINDRGLPVAITLSRDQASDKATVAALLAAHPRRATWLLTMDTMPVPSLT